MTDVVSSRRIIPLVLACLLCLANTTWAEQWPTPDQGDTPNAYITADGELWVVFVHQQQAWLTRSDDMGQHFGPAVAVNAAAEDIEHNGENRPKLIVDEAHNTVYVSWTKKTEGRHTGDIRFTRSTDGGLSFEPVRTVNDDGLLTSHRFDSMMLTEAGTLYLTWLDKRELEYAAERGEHYEGSGVFYTVSRDQGASFSPNYQIADHSCECCRIAVAPHGDDGMALMWRHIYDNSTRDHAIATVDAYGNVAHKARASTDDWQIQACPHHGPDMVAAMQDERYHLTWFSNGNIHRGIHYGLHDLKTGTTGQLFEVDGRPGASHPQLAWLGERLYLIWKRFDGEQTRLFLRYSDNHGSSWSEPDIIRSTTGGSDHPLLINGPRGLYVSWLTEDDGYLFFALEEDRVKPFTADSFEQILQQHEGEEFLLALWSVDCPPCMLELQMLGELRQQYPQLPVVLVSTDHISYREDAMDWLLRYNLDDLPSWMFAERFAERLRFSIDPNWFGELPRSYHFDHQHQSRAHSGVLTEAQVRDWMDLSPYRD